MISYKTTQFIRRKERADAIVKVTSAGSVLRLLEDFQDDKSVVMAALCTDCLFSKSGSSFQYASDSLKDDSKFALEVCASHFESLPFVSERLRNDKDFILKLVKKTSKVIPYLTEYFLDDFDIVKTAFGKYKDILKFFAPRWREDPKMVIKLISSPRHLINSPELWKNNKDIVLSSWKSKKDMELLEMIIHCPYTFVFGILTCAKDFMSRDIYDFINQCGLGVVKWYQESYKIPNYRAERLFTGSIVFFTFC